MGYPNFGKAKTIVLPYNKTEGDTIKEYKELYGIDLNELFGYDGINEIYTKIPENTAFYIKARPQDICGGEEFSANKAETLFPAKVAFADDNAVVYIFVEMYAKFSADEPDDITLYQYILILEGDLVENINSHIKLAKAGE